MSEPAVRACRLPDDYTTAICRGPAPVAGTLYALEADATNASSSGWAEGFRRFSEGAWRDFVSTNTHIGGKGAKFVGGMLTAGAVAARYESLTPIQWMLRGFGPLPAEFTRSGAIRVFRFGFGQRLGRVAMSAGMNFVYATLAFEGGVAVGAVVNQTLPEPTKMAIGGTINEIVNEGGYRLLWEKPFGIDL